MSYYKLLGLTCEPFSTSPDPAFLYLSRPHRAALYKLRIALELKRGLSMVAGDIGTGKTTLARRLSQILFQDERIDFHLILNPIYREEKDFLKALMDAFGLPTEDGENGTVENLASIERYLFQKGLEEDKTVVLLIDEAQQLSRRALEILRALLNYETNEHKLLQVILFGQRELVSRLTDVPNFWDRISTKITLPPLEERETFEMIDFRLRQADYSGSGPLFTHQAVERIYRKTHGYPRRITMLCHDALEYLVMMDERQVTEKIVRGLYEREERLLALAK